MVLIVTLSCHCSSLTLHNLFFYQFLVEFKREHINAALEYIESPACCQLLVENYIIYILLLFLNQNILCWYSNERSQ